jgi:hypothetical protein
VATVNTSTGEISYTPNPNFNGVNTIIYRICDNQGACAAGTVTITVTPVNDPPLAVDDPFPVTNEDSPLNINVLANDVDIDGDPLTVLTTSTPASGIATINPDFTITYTPNAEFSGVDIFTYVISDGILTDTATVTVTVIPVNDPPVALDDTALTAEDTSQLVFVLDNDTDIDGPFPLSIITVSSAANGTVVIDPPGVRYTPNPNFSGDDTFTYTISDGLLSDTAMVTVTVISINDPPVAADDSYATPINTLLTVPAPGLLANDTDVDSGSLTVVLPPVTNPTNGTLSLNTDGSFTYTPNPGFTGADSFTYRASDGFATSNIATVTITVGP